MSNFEEEYEHVRGGGPAYHAMPRGLIEVWGGEAEEFLNGLITNDVALLEDGATMYAAFPNAKGRLLAIVRVKRRGEKYLFETEDATHDTVFQNLFKFTMAGDFKVEDVSENYRFVSTWNMKSDSREESLGWFGRDVFVPRAEFAEFTGGHGALEISKETYETLRIEEGIPLYGVDMDETTVVPEVGIEGLINYQKGCYIGQEVIARIHFLGKPAKVLKGLMFESREEPDSNDLTNEEGKNAGRITSTTFSPHMRKTIALGYIRSAFSNDGTKLSAGGKDCIVKKLPFFD